MNLNKMKLKISSFNLNYKEHLDKKTTVGKIHDVIVTPLAVHTDDRGDLFEVYRSSWFGNSPRQVYVVGNPVRNTIRAFHCHDELIDFFTIVSGRALFVLVDCRKDSDTYGIRQRIILTGEQPKCIKVPAGVMHGWKSLTDNTMLLSIASHEYNKDCPDEYRVPFTSYGEDWKQIIK